MGVGILRVAGDSLTSKKVGSWFLGFEISKFQGFKHLFCFQKIFVSYYQMSISCFLVDIDLISKILKILLDGSPSFVGARLFQNGQQWIPETSTFTNIIFLNMFQGFFLIF